MHVDPVLLAASISAVTAAGIAVYQRRAGNRKETETEKRWQRQAKELRERIEALHERQHTEDREEIERLRRLFDRRQGGPR